MNITDFKRTIAMPFFIANSSGKKIMKMLKVNWRLIYKIEDI